MGERVGFGGRRPWGASRAADTGPQAEHPPPFSPPSPRPLCPLRPPSSTTTQSSTSQGERLLVERLVAEEYMLDTCHFFEPDRVECAKRLAGGACWAGLGWAGLGARGGKTCRLRAARWTAVAVRRTALHLPHLLLATRTAAAAEVVLPACRLGRAPDLLSLRAAPPTQACRCPTPTSRCCARCCLARCCACRARPSSPSCTPPSWSTSASCAASSPAPCPPACGERAGAAWSRVVPGGQLWQAYAHTCCRPHLVSSRPGEQTTLLAHSCTRPILPTHHRQRVLCAHERDGPAPAPAPRRVAGLPPVQL